MPRSKTTDAPVLDVPFALDELMQSAQPSRPKSALAREAKAAKDDSDSVAESVSNRAFGWRAGHLIDDMGLWVDVDLLDDNPFQPREVIDPKEQKERANSFDLHGQLQPAKARIHPRNPNRYQLAYGHCRKQLVKEGHNAGIRRPNPERYIGKLRIEVEDLNNEQMLGTALDENDKRSGFNAIERAKAYIKLRVLATESLVAEGKAKIYEGDEPEKESTIVDGKRYELASIRLVAQRNGIAKTTFHRTMQILTDLPKAWHSDFQPDRKNPDKFVLTPRHGRLLVELEKYPKIQKAIHGQMMRDKISAAEAERRAEQMRANQQDPLDAELKEAAKKELARQDAEKREKAKQENSKALSGGNSHLQSVPSSNSSSSGSTTSSGAAASTQEASAEKETVSGSTLWFQAEDKLDELADILSKLKVEGSEETAESHFAILENKKAGVDFVFKAVKSEVKKLKPNHDA